MILSRKEVETEMWRRKKLIIVVVLTAVMLAGSIGGVVLAQTENGDDSQPKTLLDRVAEILVGEGVNITSEQLKDAFAQAQSEMRTDALQSYLENLVKEGKITQEEADQYLEWWQSRPDMEPFRQQLREWQQARPDMPPELKEWQQSRPDVPVGFGFRGHGWFRGMGGMRGFGRLCVPAE